MERSSQLDGVGLEMNDWSNYRRRAGDLTWRLATVEDIPDILKLWRTTEKLLGKQDKPMLFAPPVLLAMVAEDDHGKICDAFYCEAVLDVTKIGCSRRGFEGSEVIVEDLRKWAARRSFRLARIAIPKKLAGVMAATLKLFGFSCVDDNLSHWARRL
jgi:hypothetical protein